MAPRSTGDWGLMSAILPGDGQGRQGGEFSLLRMEVSFGGGETSAAFCSAPYRKIVFCLGVGWGVKPQDAAGLEDFFGE